MTLDDEHMNVKIAQYLPYSDDMQYHRYKNTTHVYFTVVVVVVYLHERQPRG